MPTPASQPGAGVEQVADHERVGVVVNTAVTGIPETEANVNGLMRDGLRGVSAYYVPSMIPNMPACEVAIDLGLHGPVTASALACASGNAALLDARRLILSGEADVVVAGGTDAGISPVMFAGLSNMGALSANNDDPAGQPAVLAPTATASSTARGPCCSWSSRPNTLAAVARASTRPSPEAR